MTADKTQALVVLEQLAAKVPLSNRIDNPHWRDSYQTWMAYVPNEIREAWSDLPREAKLLAVIFCEELVSRERVD